MPELACLMLTSFADDDALFNAVMAGAAGYVLKQIHGSDLVGAVRTVAGGQSLLDPQTTTAMLARLREQAARKDPLAALSEQERQILELIGEGLTNRQIGERMYPRRENRQELRVQPAVQTQHAAPYPGRGPGRTAEGRPPAVKGNLVPRAAAALSKVYRLQPAAVTCDGRLSPGQQSHAGACRRPTSLLRPVLTERDAPHQPGAALRRGADLEGTAQLLGPFLEVAQSAAPAVGGQSDAVVGHGEDEPLPVGLHDISALDGLGVPRDVGQRLAQHGEQLLGDRGGTSLSSRPSMLQRRA